MDGLDIHNGFIHYGLSRLIQTIWQPCLTRGFPRKIMVYGKTSLAYDFLPAATWRLVYLIPPETFELELPRSIKFV